MEGPDFKTITSFVKETTAEPDDIIYALLTSIIEEKTTVIN